MAKMFPTLTITVNPEGKVSTDFSHFLGQACLTTGQQLHTLLAEWGIETEVTQFIPKPELSAPPAMQVVSQVEALQEGGQS